MPRPLDPTRSSSGPSDQRRKDRTSFHSDLEEGREGGRGGGDVRPDRPEVDRRRSYKVAAVILRSPCRRRRRELGRVRASSVPLGRGRTDVVVLGRVGGTYRSSSRRGSGSSRTTHATFSGSSPTAFVDSSGSSPSTYTHSPRTVPPCHTTGFPLTGQWKRSGMRGRGPSVKPSPAPGPIVPPQRSGTSWVLRDTCGYTQTETGGAPETHSLWRLSRPMDRHVRVCVRVRMVGGDSDLGDFGTRRTRVHRGWERCALADVGPVPRGGRGLSSPSDPLLWIRVTREGA